MWDIVGLFLDKRRGRLCVAEFLRALCSLGGPISQVLGQVSSMDDLRELSILESKVQKAIDVYGASLWVGWVVTVLCRLLWH
jgi:hypothetical protein